MLEDHKKRGDTSSELRAELVKLALDEINLSWRGRFVRDPIIRTETKAKWLMGKPLEELIEDPEGAVAILRFGREIDAVGLGAFTGELAQALRDAGYGRVVLAIEEYGDDSVTLRCVDA